MKNMLHMACWFLILLFQPLEVFSLLPYQDYDVQALLQTRHIRLIVMCHGEATHQVQHLISSTESPGIYLTDHGIQQVKQAITQLASERIDAVYVSPLYRSLQTAHLMSVNMQIPYQKLSVDPLLKEQFYGEYENRSFPEYVAYFRKESDIYSKAVPGGEPGSLLREWTRDFLWKMASKHKRETVLVITQHLNCCHIHKCLKGSYKSRLKAGEFMIYEFN